MSFMKKSTIISISILLLSVCWLLCLLLSGFYWQNATLMTICILVNALLFIRIIVSGLKDGFKYSLIIIFLILSVIECLLSIFSPNSFYDNPIVIVVFCLIILQIVLILVCNTMSSNK